MLASVVYISLGEIDLLTRCCSSWLTCELKANWASSCLSLAVLVSSIPSRIDSSSVFNSPVFSAMADRTWRVWAVCFEVAVALARNKSNPLGILGGCHRSEATPVAVDVTGL